MTARDDLMVSARQWAARDFCDDDRRLALEMIERARQQPEAAAPWETLQRHFGSMLEFGTAGLRGRVGPGPGAMNRALVRITTRAVALELLEGHAAGSLVVLGYDARLSSRDFAEEVAGVLVGAGLSVRYFERPVPTPVLAFALKHQRAVAGIVITASHNPKDDNGYKLYGANGIQIVSPTDRRIAGKMRALDEPREIPYVAGALLGQHPLARPMSADVVDDYFRAIAATRPVHGACRDLRIVYTPLHGVGGRFVARALAEAGFTNVEVVPEQVEPDGHFPTAPNPNPEREGTLDLALQLAQRVNADVVLANDPDADRLAVAAPHAGSYVKLAGNQIGVLLADTLLRDAPPKALVVRSIVSSPMLDVIAARRGVACEQTLTGFKWLWAAALELQQTQGLRFLFGFEEALGYSIADIVRDKDGVGAALQFAEMVAGYRARGTTVFQELERLYREYGLWVSTQLPLKRDTPRGLVQIQQAIPTLLQSLPSRLGGAEITGCVDYRSGAEQRPRWLEATPLLELELGTRGRVLVRPSGTEPLLKVYVDLRVDLDSGDDVWAVEEQLAAEADALAAEVARLSGL